MTLLEMGKDPDSLAAQAPRSNRRWIWFFTLLAVLSVCGITIPWVYNVLQQLRPDQLTAARSLWDDRGPKDYDLEFISKEDDKPGRDASADPEVLAVSIHVRQGLIVSATRNGQDLSPGQAQEYGVEGIFELIQRNFDRDGQPGESRSYAHALFDKKDGHPIHYVRRVLGSRQRLEMIIQLTLPGEEPARKPTFPDRN